MVRVRFALASLATVALVLMPITSSLALAETLLIDSANPNHITPPWDPSHGVWSSTLELGQPYWVEVEGVWLRDPVHACDAEWYAPGDPPGDPWLEEYPPYPGLLDVQINEVSPDWLGFLDVNGDGVPQANEWFEHTLSPTHRYGLPWTGEGVPVKFSIYDLGYENSGVLTVRITPLNLTWELRSVSGPSPRRAAYMAYDAARGVTVLFGGWDASLNVVGDTWEWNGSAWTQRFPQTSPPAAVGGAMAYDSQHGVSVLFGGYPIFTETWEWDGTDTTWTRSADGPSRGGPGMAYDHGRSRMVLFGGNNSQSQHTNDTFERVETEWIQRAEIGPAEREGPAMAYDTARGRTVMFGGGPGDDYTWEWDGNASAWASHAVSGPNPRALTALAYDAVRQVTVRFGGGYWAPLDGETWEWDGTTWTQRVPCGGPGPRWGHKMVYDSARHVVVLFGGCVDYMNGSTYFGDTWEYGLVQLTPGDLNCDGIVDFGDINPFVAAMNGAQAYFEVFPGCHWMNADCNADGCVDFGDINPFVALLTGRR